MRDEFLLAWVTKQTAYQNYPLNFYWTFSQILICSQREGKKPAVGRDNVGWKTLNQCKTYQFLFSFDVSVYRYYIKKLTKRRTLRYFDI